MRAAYMHRAREVEARRAYTRHQVRRAPGMCRALEHAPAVRTRASQRTRESDAPRTPHRTLGGFPSQAQGQAPGFSVIRNVEKTCQKKRRANPERACVPSTYCTRSHARNAPRTSCG